MTVKNKERGGAEEGEITTTVHSNCNSYINKAPALQATMYSHY